VETIESSVRWHGWEGTHNLAVVVENGHDHATGRALGQPEVQGSTIIGILSGAGVLRLALGRLLVEKAVGRTGPEEMVLLEFGRSIELLKWREVVQDPNPPTVGAHDQIIKMRLDSEPMHRCTRQVPLERLPIDSVVQRNIDPVFGAGIQEPSSVRVFPNHVDIAEHGPREVARERAP
jgi:hypothetical protein